MKKSPSRFLAGTAFFLILFTQSFAQPPTISYQPAITGLSAPVDLVNAGDGTGRLFIVQQGGIIRSWNGTSLSDFLNIRCFWIKPDYIWWREWFAQHGLPS